MFCEPISIDRFSVSLLAALTVLLTVGCQGSATDSENDPKTEKSSSTAAASDSQSGAVATQLSEFFQKNRSVGDSKTLFGDESPNTPTTDETDARLTTTGNDRSSLPGISIPATGQTATSKPMDPAAADSNASVSDSKSNDGAAADNVDVNRLIARIAELTEVQRTAETKDVMRDTLIEQADISTQIYESQTSFPFKMTAVKTRIHALTILDKLREPEAFEDLIEFGHQLMKRDEPELRKMGFFAVVSAQLRAYMIDSDKQDFSEIVDLVDQFTKNSFDDFELGRELALASSQLFTNQKREQATQLMRILSSNFRQSSDPKMVGLADTLVAQAAMAQVNFDKVIAKQLADEDANLPKLEAALEQIVATGATLALYNELTVWMQLFEREAKYKSINLVAEKLQTSFRELAKNEPEKYVQVLDSLDLVRTRMALIGTPFSFEGIKLADGQAFDPTTTAGKVVLITFWSGAASSQERLQLQFETKSFEDWRPRGVAMVGFNMDNDPKAAEDFFGRNPPRWVNTISEVESELGFESDFAKRSVADQTPYRILLDHNGKVAFVAVPMERLEYRINELLRKLPENATAKD